MAVPTGTRLDWSPLARESSQLQLGRAGRERLLGEEEVAPELFGLSPSKPASQGSTGIRISKLLH